MKSLKRIGKVKVTKDMIEKWKNADDSFLYSRRVDEIDALGDDPLVVSNELGVLIVNLKGPVEEHSDGDLAGLLFDALDEDAQRKEFDGRKSDIGAFHLRNYCLFVDPRGAGLTFNLKGHEPMKVEHGDLILFDDSIPHSVDVEHKRRSWGVFAKQVVFQNGD